MDKLYTINEVATKLNLSDKTLRRWEEAGRFTPSRTLGNQRRYSLDDLQILDALKHNVITEQAELLNASQAAALCGVSPATINRWENEGKIHPFITSGFTYYPKTRLLAKLDELKHDYTPEPTVTTVIPISPPPVSHPTPPRLDPPSPPKLSPLPPPKSPRSLTHQPPTMILTNVTLTLLLILSYHLIFHLSPAPISPQGLPTQAGSVQGVTTTSLDPRVDDLITKFQDHLSAEMLSQAKVVPTSTFKVGNANLIFGSATLEKGQNQISVPNPIITPTSLITANFTSDYAPAKKYWITTTAGSFTLHTDFPVSANSPFHYSLLETLPATQAATTRLVN